jgi:hypothetical protein
LILLKPQDHQVSDCVSLDIVGTAGYKSPLLRCVRIDLPLSIPAPDLCVATFLQNATWLLCRRYKTFAKILTNSLQKMKAAVFLW